MSGGSFQVQLHTLDYAVMAAYMAALLAMGAFLRRRAGMCGRSAGVQEDVRSVRADVRQGTERDDNRARF